MMDSLEGWRLNWNIVLDQCYMTGLRRGELSSYGWEEAQKAASCKQEIEYSCTIRLFFNNVYVKEYVEE